MRRYAAHSTLLMMESKNAVGVSGFLPLVVFFAFYKLYDIYAGDLRTDCRDGNRAGFIAGCAIGK